MKVFIPSNFTIKLASTKKESKPKGNNVSRRCLAVVSKIDNEFKAIVNYEKNTIKLTDIFSIKNEQLILPFTEKSLELKGKIYVFAKEKDVYGNNICIIRDNITANISPGIPNQYDVFKENILISGHIIRNNNKLYFEYEDLISYHYLSEYRIHDVTIDDTKPLFNK